MDQHILIMNYPNIPYDRRGNMFRAPIFSLAGIVQITSRASLFFDSMLALGKGKLGLLNKVLAFLLGGFDTPYVVTITEVQSPLRRGVHGFIYYAGNAFSSKQ